ncbi:hypothetical protein AB835_03380 [Candidatus Endobugula sertula]|uniref:CBS domain-containing protein n=1 Tax=Candidatus Endobugula sertula TaxID=62101 RepID=A0A1D2QSE5_9GAMM|nr:hypothetical protein AB835_03380 [Candidatus Endobugula sertula]
MHINKIMTTETCSCELDTTLDKVAIMMWENDCGSIPILDDKKHPVGMVTDRDIAIGAALKTKPLWQITTGEINNDRPIFTCKLNDNVHDVLTTMKTEKIRRVPVINNKSELCGMVSMSDIVNVSEQKRDADIPYKEAMNTLKAIATHH